MGPQDHQSTPASLAGNPALHRRNGQGNDTSYSQTPKTPTGRKRSKPIDLTHDDDNEPSQRSSSKRRKRTRHHPKEDNEKRLKKWRSHPPLSYRQIFERAQTHRFFVIERTSTGSEADPEQTVEIAGTTGNLYTVKINRLPSCNCPHAQKGHQCKHIVYILHFVLKAPRQLQHQTAFLTSELQQILTKAPPAPSTKPTTSSPADDPIRKPIEDDCPICCMDFSPPTEEIVYCKAACGNNVHKQCFEQWAAQKKSAGALASGGVTCPFCRAPWQGDEDVVNKISKIRARTSQEGYLNVADQLGLSGARDYSSYHQPWVRIQRMSGNLRDDEDEPMWY